MYGKIAKIAQAVESTKNSNPKQSVITEAPFKDQVNDISSGIVVKQDNLKSQRQMKKTEGTDGVDWGRSQVSSPSYLLIEAEAEITSPSNGGTVDSRNSFVVYFTVETNYPNYLTDVGLFDNGVELEKRRGFSTTEFIVAGNTLADGLHNLTIRVYDSKGLVTESAAVAITIFTA